MILGFNIRHLERGDLRLEGEIAAADLGLEPLDELIRFSSPISYALEVSSHEQGFLLQGQVSVKLACECVRCLQAFSYTIELRDWSCLLPNEGEDKVLVHNDSVDLTPYLREDIVLSLPQHPLCKPECSGLGQAPRGGVNPCGVKQADDVSSAWTELNKLKF